MNKSKVGYFSNIEEETVNNSSFRKVLFTGKFSQLVLMSIDVGDDIGLEVHDDIDQFIRIEEGSADVVIGDEVHQAEAEYAIIVPAGFKHNVTNTGDKPLKLYTIYSPAEHPDGTHFATKKEALATPHHH